MEIKKLKEQIEGSSNSFYPLTSKDAVVGLTDLVNNKINEAKGELESYVDEKVPENIEISVCEDCIENLNIEIGEYAFDVLEKALYKKTGENTWELVPKGDSNIYVKRNLIIRLFRVFFDEEISSYSSWERGEHAGVIENDRSIFKVCIKGGNNPEFKEVTPSVGDIFVVDVPEKDFCAYIYTNNGLVDILKSNKEVVEKAPDIYIKWILSALDFSKIDEILNDDDPCYVLFDNESEVDHRHLNYIDGSLDSGFPIPYASVKTISVNESEKEGKYKSDYEKYNNTSIILGKDVERLSLGKRTNNVNVDNFSGGNTYSDSNYRYNESNNTFRIKSDDVWKDYTSLDIYKINNKETPEESNSKLIALLDEEKIANNFNNLLKLKNSTIISYIEDFLIMKYKILKGYFYINPDICAIVTSTIDWDDGGYQLRDINNYIKENIPQTKHFIYQYKVGDNITKVYLLRRLNDSTPNTFFEKIKSFTNDDDIYYILFKMIPQSYTITPPTRPEGIFIDIVRPTKVGYYRLEKDTSTTYFNQPEEEPINDLLQ